MALKINADVPFYLLVQAACYGSSLTLLVNGTVETSATDSSYASGMIGFSSTWADGLLGSVTVTAGTPPAIRTAVVVVTGSNSLSGLPSWLWSNVTASNVPTSPVFFGGQSYQFTFSGYWQQFAPSSNSAWENLWTIFG
jgi:hypothetical protein